MRVPGARRPDRRRTVESDRRRPSRWSSGATPTHRRWRSPTAGSTSPRPSTCSPRCSPTGDGGSSAWDQRGHGDSDWAHLYSWEADLRDAAAVIATLGPRAAAVRRPLQGRQPDDAPGEHGAPPGLRAGQPGRAAVAPGDVRRDRARAHPPPARRDGRLARAPAHPRRQAAPPRHHRRAGRAAGTDEPAARHRTGCGTWSPWAPPTSADGWRWKLDPTHAHGRLRPVAAGVVDAAAARHRRARDGGAGTGARGHGLGHRARGRRALPPAGRTLRGARRGRPLRAHRAAATGGRPGPGVPARDSAVRSGGSRWCDTTASTWRCTA